MCIMYVVREIDVNINRMTSQYVEDEADDGPKINLRDELTLCCLCC